MRAKFIEIKIKIIFLALTLLANLAYADMETSPPPKGFVLLITEVLPGSLAEKSGLFKNDLIYSFGEKVFYNSNSPGLAKEFSDFINSLPPGTYRMEVLRKGERIGLTVNIPSSTGSPRLGVVLEVLENDPQAYFDKALKALKGASNREDLKKVTGLFERAKHLSPEWAEVYYNLGLLYENLDYYDLATENFLSYLRLTLRKGSSRDVEEASVLVGRNRRKQELLERIKSRMVKGRWNLVKRIPEGKTSGSFSPQFKLDENGKMWKANSLLAARRAGVDMIEKNIRKYPWFQVEFDGRYFEIREFYIWPVEERNRRLYFPVYTSYRGEIEIDSSNPMIKVREYARNALEETYPDMEVAEREGFKNLKSIRFDQIRDFRYEYHFKLE